MRRLGLDQAKESHPHLPLSFSLKFALAYDLPEALGALAQKKTHWSKRRKMERKRKRQILGDDAPRASFERLAWWQCAVETATTATTAPDSAGRASITVVGVDGDE